MTKLKAIIKKYWGELVFVFSNTYSLGITMLASIIATAFIDPLDMGVIQTVLLVHTYMSFIHFGVFNGLNRNLAFYKARGDYELVQDMVNTTYMVSFTVAVIGGLIAVGLFFYFIATGKTIVYLLSAVMLFFLQIFQPLANALETTYRSGQEFRSLGLIKNKESTLYAIFTLFPMLFGYIGKIVADILKCVVGYVMRFLKRPYSMTGRGSMDSLTLLIRTGLPMLISGYLWTVFTACDRTFISKYLGMEDMGLYTISNYVMLAVMAVPVAVNTLLYPKAAARYGSSGDIKCLKEFWKKSLMLYASMLIPLCAVLYFVLPYFVGACMPKYMGGVTAAQYSLLTCMTFVYKGPSVLFGTLRRNLLDIIMMIVAIIAFWGLALLFKDYFVTIESVSLLRFLISLIHMIIILFITYRIVNVK